MRFIHIADTHLGLAAFNKIDPDTGLNLRENLIYENFLAAIDKIIAEKPDALVHAGDLFHHVKPKTKAYTTALDGLERLRDAGIPVAAIAGNHSIAKTRYTTPPFNVLEYMSKDLHAAYRYRYVPVELGDTIFHLIPNMLKAEHYIEEFNKISPSPDHHNVLVTHGLAGTLRDRRLNTVAEHEITATMLSDRFDYIALGHYHRQQQVADNAWYSGSFEFCSYNEIYDTKGALIVDTGGGTVIHLELPKTPMIYLGTIICEDLIAQEVMDEVLELTKHETSLEGAMCMITLDGIKPDVLRAMDRNTVNDIRKRTLDLKFRIRKADESMPVLQGTNLMAVDYVGEFEKFVTENHLNESQEKYVLKYGSEILKKVLRERKEVDNASS